MALDDFITHSHYPQEKIVWAYEGVVDNTNPYWNPVWDYGLFIPIPIELDANNVLLDGIWTTDNWLTSYPINANGRVYGWIEEDGSYYQDFDNVSASVMFNAFSIVSYPIFYVQPSVGDNRTAKVRLWAYITASDTLSHTNTQTSSQLAHSLQKTTQLAQMNMVSENVIVVPDGGTETLFHNLGFRPFVRVWKKNPDGGWRRNSTTISVVGGVPNYNERITTDSQTITIYATDPYGAGEAQEYLVRIYSYGIPQ